MTREEWKDRLPLIQKFVEGKDVYHHHNGCHLETSPAFDDAVIKYRVVDPPQPPKFIPWTIDTCPGGWVRPKGTRVKFMIIQMNTLGVMFLVDVNDNKNGYFYWDQLISDCEHLKPDGTWGPCGIEVTPLQKAPDIT